MADEVKERGLTPNEKSMARIVFENTLPYDRILIGNDLGAQDRAYMDNQGDYYVLRLGPVGYIDATSQDSLYGSGYSRMCETVFIHELVHVWQAYRGIHTMISSYLTQAAYAITTLDWRNSYEYTAGEYWCHYNVEQQAKIVEHWFDNEWDNKNLLPYINDYIRKGKLHHDHCNHRLF